MPLHALCCECLSPLLLLCRRLVRSPSASCSARSTLTGEERGGTRVVPSLRLRVMSTVLLSPPAACHGS